MWTPHCGVFLHFHFLSPVLPIFTIRSCSFAYICQIWNDKLTRLLIVEQIWLYYRNCVFCFLCVFHFGSNIFLSFGTTFCVIVKCRPKGARKSTRPDYHLINHQCFHAQAEHFRFVWKSFGECVIDSIVCVWSSGKDKRTQRLHADQSKQTEPSTENVLSAPTDTRFVCRTTSSFAFT